MENLIPNIQEAAAILKDSEAVVISSGAGISKESGIPTFRDAPNALWANYDPMELATREGFSSDPELVWRWYVDRRKMIGACEPNPGHYAIAEMETIYPTFTVITQNIDNLHRKAGSNNIIEVHGNVFKFKCFDQDHRVDELPEGDDAPPRCVCGSYLRPDVVWFGEPLPEDGIRIATQALESCDVIIVVGTSGTVYPAASFPSFAKSCGAAVIEVNPEETPITVDADLFLKGPSGVVLPRLLEEIKNQRG
jgi:NAD-dependent deacetylase